MRTPMKVVRSFVRPIGVALLALGLLFWANLARALVPVHMLLGLLLVLLLWVQAVLARRAGVGRGLVALAATWGLVVPTLGLTQARQLPGDAHWVIQLLHLLVGLVALGLVERLATQAQHLSGSEAATSPMTRSQGGLQ